MTHLRISVKESREKIAAKIHWHGDIFDLPQDAVPLASSEKTRHQAFRFGKNAYGFLFHLEVTKEMIQEPRRIGKLTVIFQMPKGTHDFKEHRCISLQ